PGTTPVGSESPEPSVSGQPELGEDRPASTALAANRPHGPQHTLSVPVYADDRLALYAETRSTSWPVCPTAMPTACSPHRCTGGCGITAPAAGSAATPTASTTPGRAATFRRPGSP